MKSNSSGKSAKCAKKSIFFPITKIFRNKKEKIKTRTAKITSIKNTVRITWIVFSSLIYSIPHNQFKIFDRI